MRGIFGQLAARFRPTIFKGQKGQDRWVICDILPWKRRGFFLDLAAADGVTHSNTHVLEKWFGWTGICIEPNPEFFAELKARRLCVLDQSVISDTPETVQFRTDNGQLGGVVADDTDNNPRVRGHQLAQAKIIELEALPLNAILDRHNAPRVIDYFSLDVEGCEERVLRTLDFRRYQFRCLTVERPTPGVNAILFEQGYVFVKNYSFDSFYIHSSVLETRPIPCEPFEQVPPKDW
jgi:FkbM family methyltransferase